MMHSEVLKTLGLPPPADAIFFLKSTYSRRTLKECVCSLCCLNKQGPKLLRCCWTLFYREFLLWGQEFGRAGLILLNLHSEAQQVDVFFNYSDSCTTPGVGHDDGAVLHRHRCVHPHLLHHWVVPRGPPPTTKRGQREGDGLQPSISPTPGHLQDSEARRTDLR